MAPVNGLVWARFGCGPAACARPGGPPPSARVRQLCGGFTSFAAMYAITSLLNPRNAKRITRIVKSLETKLASMMCRKRPSRTSLTC